MSRVLMFVDWRGDPDERLTGSPDTEVGRVFAAAARRGVDVRGLVWRSHWDRLAFSAAENRRLGDEINDAGGQCLLDMRVRTWGSHHQKFVVLRHGSRPALDIAFLGGINLCHGRRDDAAHAGDPNHRRWLRRTGHDRRGTTCSLPSRDRPSVTWRPYSVNAGMTRRASAAARCDGSRTGSDTTTPRTRRCPSRALTSNPPEPMPCSCSARILAAPVATPSPHSENAAWRAATPKPWPRHAT
jgi:hypothetical protein